MPTRIDGKWYTSDEEHYLFFWDDLFGCFIDAQDDVNGSEVYIEHLRQYWFQYLLVIVLILVILFLFM